MKVAIVMGGYSKESKVSLESGKFILNHLNPKKYTIYNVIILKDLWYVQIDNTQIPLNKSNFSFKLKNKIIQFDVILNTIHGTPGEDGQLQAYWNFLKIPFSGCGFYESALTFNKRDTLAVLARYNIPIAQSIFYKRGNPYNYNNIVQKIGIPFIVKPNRSGSSLGVSKVNYESEFQKALEIAFQQDSELLIESFLSGIEVSVGVLQYHGIINPIGITEIISNNDFFDYSAKYLGESQEITPARISKDVKNIINNLTIKIYEFLSMKGFARIDFIIVNQVPYFIEINTNPGLSQESIFPKQVKKSGLNFSDILDEEIYRITKKNKIQ